MFVAGLAKTLTLWTAVVVLGHHAYQASSRAATLDLRRPDGLLWIGGPLILGLALAWLAARRRPARWAPLGADRLALALLMAWAALEAWAHVEGHTSIRVLREEIPPQLAPLFPLWTLAVPLWLSRSGARLDAAAQGLRLLTLLLSAGSALFLLPGSAALTLALPLALLQFQGRRERPVVTPLALAALLAVALLALATWFAHTPLLATPALAWILAAGCLTLGIAARPREHAELRGLLVAAVTAPLLVALADVVLSVELAQQVSVRAALDTRPTLFRQHPNFLAPLFAVGCLLATSLAWASARARVPAALTALLLLAATWHTDSNAGKGALLVGLLLLPALRVGLPVARRLPLRRLALAAALLLALGATAGWLLRDHPSLDLARRFDRFEKSLDYRLDAWRNSLAIVREHPLTGLGPGTFVSVERFSPDSRFYNEPTSPHPHNVFLYVAQAGGLPCLVVVLAWLALLVLALARAALDPARHALGRPLAVGLLATLLALLGANLLDLGLALETVVPAPVFLLTGLVLGGSARAERALRVGPALLAGLVLVAPWWTLGVQRVRADTLVERAQLRSFLATDSVDADGLRAAARRDLVHAVELDPDHLQAHDLLARWLEALPGGGVEAHAVIQALIARAPHHGPAHSLLAHFFLRVRDDTKAAASLRRALESGHGSVHLRRDRARLIETLARLGHRDQTFEELVENLRLEAALIHEIAWTEDPDTGALTLPVERGAQPPIALVDAIGAVLDRHRRDEAAGRPVGRRFWMDVPNAFRFAGRDDLALDVYAWLEEQADEIDFVRDNLHVIAKERGFIALERGDLPEALAQLERAAELSAGTPAQPYFITQAERVRDMLSGATPADAADAADADDAEVAHDAEPAPAPLDGDDEAAAAEAFRRTGEILDQPTALLDNLESRAAARLRAEDPGGAARLLHKALLYEDDLLRRAARLARVAELHLAAGEGAESERAALASLAHLDAKPLPLEVLVEGLADSLPARLARTLCDAWRLQGVPSAALYDAAWARIPRFTSSRHAMSLLRMELARESGRADQLEREADLALLGDPTSRPALWARLEALEALGRHPEMHTVMAPLAEGFAGRRDPEAVVAAMVRTLRARQEEPGTWREIGVARLLQGRYREAAGLFRSARDLLPPEDTRAAARLLGWEARAQLLAGEIDAARRTLHEAVAADPERRILALRLDTLGPAAGAADGGAP